MRVWSSWCLTYRSASGGEPHILGVRETVVEKRVLCVEPIGWLPIVGPPGLEPGTVRL